MARRICLGLVLVAATSVLPAHADTMQLTVSCSGSASLGGVGTCSQSFSLPRFDSRDEIDYSTLVARFTSLAAGDWRVEGTIEDARGVLYFEWYCDVGRSVVLGASSVYLDRSCEATRRTISSTGSFFVADVNRSHRMTITARAASCVPTSVLGCRFEGAATFLIAG